MISFRIIGTAVNLMYVSDTMSTVKNTPLPDLNANV